MLSQTLFFCSQSEVQWAFENHVKKKTLSIPDLYGIDIG